MATWSSAQGEKGPKCSLSAGSTHSEFCSTAGSVCQQAELALQTRHRALQQLLQAAQVVIVQPTPGAQAAQAGPKAHFCPQRHASFGRSGTKCKAQEWRPAASPPEIVWQAGMQQQLSVPRGVQARLTSGKAVSPPSRVTFERSAGMGQS